VKAAARYRSVPRPAPRTPWRQAGWCVIDLELTGLDPDRDEVISYAAVPIDAGRITLGAAVRGLVRPQRDPSPASVRVHRMRAADLASAPGLEAAADALLAAMTGRVVVAHAAWVERAFLRRTLRRRHARVRGPLVDTGVLGRVWFAERDGRPGPVLPLGQLATALGLPVHRPHDALGDALTTAQAFLALATHLDATAPQTVRSLARAEDRLRSLQAFPP
jgi:DNA polymerase-3 subunit epsilon